MPTRDHTPLPSLSDIHDSVVAVIAGNELHGVAGQDNEVWVGSGARVGDKFTLFAFHGLAFHTFAFHHGFGFLMDQRQDIASGIQLHADVGQSGVTVVGLGYPQGLYHQAQDGSG